MWEITHLIILHLTSEMSAASTSSDAEHPDSGFGDGKDSLQRYADDVYAQSGGVRVRGEELMPLGVQVCETFLSFERHAQRAWLWRTLGLGNVNFVHGGRNAQWLTVLTPPRSIRSYSAHELSEITQMLRFEDAQELKAYVEQLEQHEPRGSEDIIADHVRDTAWDLGHVFRNAYDSQSASQTVDANSSPHARHHDAVVNYRANERMLIKERLFQLNRFADHLNDPSLLMDDLVHYLEANVADVYASLQTRTTQRMMLKALLTRKLYPLKRPPISVDVNVDVLMREGRQESWYGKLCTSIESQLESFLTSRDGSLVSARQVLNAVAKWETERTLKYEKFNNPATVKRLRQHLPPVQLDSSTSSLHELIERVYARALLRRSEFEKMSKPVVVSDGHARTYRVHFGDPEQRYVREETTIALQSKEWYEAVWTRLLEPIFKDVVLTELVDTPLRNIVLMDVDPSRASVQAYVHSNGENMVVYCNKAVKNFHEADRAMRHEYEHVVDAATSKRTMNAYRVMEFERDVSTLSVQTLETKIKGVLSAMDDLLNRPPPRTDAEKERRSLWRNQLKANLEAWSHARDVKKSAELYIYNSDTCRGLPSSYAQFSAREAVAEQRFAMRNAAIRTALLRRMSRHARRGPHQDDAARQKVFYDVARHEMRDVAPRLYHQWGENYDGRPAHEWGLLPGEVPKTDKHFTFIMLDKTLATKYACDALATTLLQKGYDVAIMSYDLNADSAQSNLQSNLDDSPHSVKRRHATLLLMGGSHISGKKAASIVCDTFDGYTITGRPQSDDTFPVEPTFEKISFLRPVDHLDVPPETMVDFLAAFEEHLTLAYGQKPHQKTSIHQGPVRVSHEGTIVSVESGKMSRIGAIWPEDKNLYRSTLFRGWFIDGVERWERVDNEANTFRMCI